MALAPGTRLGPYEVLAPLGAGGMGEVYRARDTRLDRTVAIKVLAPDLASDGEFRQRFHAEARAISQLTHPHICTLHDLGEHAGTTFLVMELLAGETLADRLARGTPEQPALTLEQALQIGIQVAEALATAHAQGIVHRDLKPGNIMLTKAATPSAVPHAKLLDFGLAKSTPVVTGTALSIAPTTPPQAVTAQGAILGTIQYMAPEQVEGGAVDARTDIFALGSVLYELLTGRKAFEGKSQASVMAAILEREPPPVSALQPRVPALVDATVQKCLAKQPEARWQSAADLATALRWAASGPMLPEPMRAAADGGRTALGTGSHRWRAREVVGWMLAAATAALLLRDPNPAVPVHLANLTLDDEADLSASAIQAAGFVVSPDGSRIFSQAPRGDRRMFGRDLDQPRSMTYPNTELGRVLFVSSDGQWVGFATTGTLNRLSLVDGTVVRVAETQTITTSAALSGDDRIVFSMGTNLWQVPAGGGTPAPLTTLGDDEQSQTVGGVLPGGETLLFTSWRNGRPRIEALNLVTTDRRVIVDQAAGGIYVSTGHLLFAREEALLAAPFNAGAMSAGTAVRVLDRIRVGMLGIPKLGVSRDGDVMVYAEPARASLAWVTRSGQETPLDLPPRQYQYVRIAADGRRVAFADETAVWVADLVRTGTARVSSERSLYGSLDWSPDDSHVAYSALHDLVTRAVDGTGLPRHIGASLPVWKLAPSWSRDGKHIAYSAYFGATNADIYVEPLDASSPPRAFVATPAYDAGPQFSPDSRLLAYASSETGRLEVYVTPFPGPGPKWQVSTNGGTHVRWSRDGSEIFYRNGDDMMAVPVRTRPTFSAGKPRLLFSGQYSYGSGLGLATYDVGPDGRFLMIKSDERAERPRVLLDWSASLPKRQSRQ